MVKYIFINKIAVDISQVKDEFELVRLGINRKLNDVETFLTKMDEYKTMEGKDVMERTKLKQKVDDCLKEIDDKLNKLDTVLASQKKKVKKFGDITHKFEAKKLMDERFTLLRNKSEGVLVNEEEVRDNRTHIEKLDAILVARAERDEFLQQQGIPLDRELYPEEKEAMDRWKNKIADQDRELEDVGKNVKVLKGHVKNINNKIDSTGRQIKAVNKEADNTQKNLETTNKKLKDLLVKLRSGDKICIDIILICICLGLIAVLYNVIKTKLSGTSTTTAAKNTTLLYL